MTDSQPDIDWQFDSSKRDDGVENLKKLIHHYFVSKLLGTLKIKHSFNFTRSLINNIQ